MVVAGGVSAPLSPEHQQQILQMLPEAIKMAEERSTGSLNGHELCDDNRGFRAVQTLSCLSLEAKVSSRHTTEQSESLTMLAKYWSTSCHPEEINSIVDEVKSPHSYLKSPFYKPFGYPDGAYRSGDWPD